MNKLKWIIIFLSLLSCDRDDERIPVNSLYKVDYKVGDILEYHSNTGEEFYLKVMNIYKTEITSSKNGSGAPYNIYEHQVVYYDSLDRKITNKALADRITSEQPRGYVRWPFGLYGCITSGCSKTYFETLTLNGVTYNAVYRLLQTNGKGEIIIWYYTYKHGFVGFELIGGRVYNLVL